MPPPRKINCPACGFTINAAAKTCDFCGYELEPQLDESPSSKAFRSDAIESESRPPVSSGRKNGNGKKNTAKAKSPDAREEEEEQVPEPDRKTQTTAVASQAAEKLPPEAAPAVAEKRIKELEKELADAEKELDIISKILAETNAAEAGGSAASPSAAAVQKLPERVKATDISATTTSKAIVPERPAAAASVHEYRKAKGTGLKFRARAVTAFSVVIGIALYSSAFVLSRQLGAVEEYFLLVAGTVLLSLGLYSSFEPTEAQTHRTAA